MGTVILLGVLVDQQSGTFRERRRIREAARIQVETAAG
jgi:ribose transport system permease protein